MIFLVVLFLLKNTSVFEKTINFVRGGEEGLTYDTVAIGDLVNKDTDKDGILDWEEPLWGLDPTETETTPGVPDSSVIKKLRAEQGTSTSETSGDYEENLTETDKFSRELFSTIASLNQNGAMDEATVEKITNSLAEKMKNPTPRKIFTSADIKITKSDLFHTIANYGNALNNVYLKNPIKGSAMAVLQKFIIDENNVDSSVLTELTPIIKQTQAIIDGAARIEVPQSLAPLHLEFLNSMERVVENLRDITLYDKDVIVALGGIIQYEKNSVYLETAVKNLANTINQKLNN